MQYACIVCCYIVLNPFRVFFLSGNMFESIQCSLCFSFIPLLLL